MAIVNMSYPKPRAAQTKLFQYSRADSATNRAVLPKDAIVIGAYILPSTACDGTTATVTVGFSGTAGAYINAFNVSTNDAGYWPSGNSAGSYVINMTKHTEDKQVNVTFAAGDSTTGGAGWIKLEYIVVGAGENADQ